MSCVPKFDDYFNKLNMGRVEKIIVPAKSMRQLSMPAFLSTLRNKKHQGSLFELQKNQEQKKWN